MNKGVLYLRLSKEDTDKIEKGDDSESIINQRALLMGYAKTHGIEIVDVYSDDDYSGLYDDRPGFDRLIRDSRLGKFQIVIAKSQSRFTRNMEHMEKYLHHDFPLLGIRFIGVVDGIDTDIKSNKKARQIYGLTNEWYCEDLSENIRAVLKQKMQSGQFIGAFAPYGYMKSTIDKHKLVVDETAASVVKDIFDLYLEGNSIKQICHILEDRGILNPTVYKKKQGLSYSNKRGEEFSEKYNLWSETTVKRILRNETYLGKLVQGTCKKISYKDKKIVSLPKEEWVIVESHHEAIVEESVFNKVRGLMEKRRVTAVNQQGEKKAHMFAGKIRCASCGSTMIKSGGVRGEKNDWYLRCQLANKSRQNACTSHSIRYSVIEKNVSHIIQDFVHEVLDTPRERKEILDYIKASSLLKTRIDVAQEQKKELLQKSAEGKKAMQLLYHDRAKGLLKEEMFLDLKEKFEEENAVCEKKLLQIETEIYEAERLRSLDECEEALLQKYCDFSTLTNEIVADFIDYVDVFEKDRVNNTQEIHIHWDI